MSTPTDFMADALGMWTETDDDRRLAIVRKRFAEDIRFHDADGDLTGHAGLEQFSASLRAQFPTARFELVSPPLIVGSAFLAAWRFGPPEQPGVVTGSDFVLWDGERASELYAFVRRPEA
jgi:SnoaL-like domain